MKFDELIVLLPCHGLDDFPGQLRGAEAEGLLAGWSALWHPALVATVGKMPTWRRAEYPSDVLAEKLIVVPAVAEKLLPEGIESRVANEGGHMIRGLTRRDEIVAALLVALGEDPGADAARLNTDLVADFLALGTCYLFSELLVRRMRYSSNLDDGRLAEHLVAAARAAVAGQDDEARRNLTHCVNLLVESRGRYYPVDMSLIDLTLVAGTTIGQALRKELACGQAINLMVAAEVVATMADREPASLAALREALEKEKASLVGGEWVEAGLPLLDVESILYQFTAGVSAYESHLGRRPTVYGRRRFGLTPALPALLVGLGFKGAVHVTLDDGRFPQSDTSKTRWEGNDAAAIDALGRVPLDASEPGSFVALAEKMGHSMDHDHVATVSFAHWPGQVSDFYNDLRRIAAYAPVLGKFVALEGYFADTDTAGRFSKFTPDDYRSPYLQQNVAAGRPDPLSRHVRSLRRSAASDAIETLTTLRDLLRQTISADGVARPDIGLPDADGNAASECDLDSRLDEQWSAAVQQLAAALPREKREPRCGYLALNPASYARRTVIDVPELKELPTVQPPIRAAEDTGQTKRVVVDLPPLGFAWIGPSAGQPGSNWAGEPIAAGQTLRNEFCEVAFHPTTGGIQSVHDYRTRGNRLSQQLVFRRDAIGDSERVASDAASDAASRMVAASIEVTDAGRLRGEITSRGQILDPVGKRLAGFVQRVQMTLGSRVVVVEIDLDPAETPAADPWNSYFACRYAWADSSADLRRSVHVQSHATRAKRLEAPHFIELETTQGKTALLCGGLPYHCRVGARMLDTLLVVAGESARKFRLGIGVDVPHPWMAALDLLTPPIAHVETAAPPAPTSYGWLFNLDAKNVAATHWEPLTAETDGTPTDGSAGKVAGIRVRLLETEGLGGPVQLRCFRAPASARRTDFLNTPGVELEVEGDRVLFDIGAYEWVQLEARWKT